MKNQAWRVALLVVVATGSVASEAQTATPAGGNGLAHSEVFPFDQMAVRKMVNGGESRDVLRGALATGEAVAVHESILPVGVPANPQHVIQHSEIITVMEGTVEFERGEKAEKVGPGGVIYVAMGTMHTLKNVGDVPAKYVVVQIGGDTKK
jgi:mannose-6-phosphate isomerase-like protein (cupin superfamily)